MAKGKYQKWLEPENLVRLRGWKMQGLTDEQLAQKMGIGARTLETWKNEHQQIRQAIKGGKEIANFEIENSLYEKAKGGNVTAMIFFLKNNYRDKYTDDQTDPELRKAQIRKANAEARITEAKAKAVEKASEGEDNTIIIDDVPNETEVDED